MGAERRAAGVAGEALISAAWPEAGAAVDEAALEQFGALQAVVKAIRNARAEYGVELGRKVAATVLIRGDEALRCVQGGAGGGVRARCLPSAYLVWRCACPWN